MSTHMSLSLSLSLSLTRSLSLSRSLPLSLSPPFLSLSLSLSISRSLHEDSTDERTARTSCILVESKDSKDSMRHATNSHTQAHALSSHGGLHLGNLEEVLVVGPVVLAHLHALLYKQNSLQNRRAASWDLSLSFSTLLILSRRVRQPKSPRARALNIFFN